MILVTVIGLIEECKRRLNLSVEGEKIYYWHGVDKLVQYILYID